MSQKFLGPSKVRTLAPGMSKPYVGDEHGGMERALGEKCVGLAEGIRRYEASGEWRIKSGSRDASTRSMRPSGS